MLLDNFQRACQNTAGMNFNGALLNNINIVGNPTNAAYYSVSSYGWYCDVGFGDTAVAHDDYKLADSNAIGESAGALTYVTGQTLITYPSIRMCITTYKNNGSSDVVVKELGLVGKTSNSAANDKSRNHLIARKVLDTPITVPAGATMAFTYSIDMDFSESVSAV